MGGGDLIASCLDEHAVDEFVLSVVPVFIGEGIPLIARRHRHTPLSLHSVERFEDGVVQLRYRVQNHDRHEFVATPRPVREAEERVSRTD